MKSFSVSTYSAWADNRVLLYAPETDTIIFLFSYSYLHLILSITDRAITDRTTCNVLLIIHGLNVKISTGVLKTFKGAGGGSL